MREENLLGLVPGAVPAAHHMPADGDWAEGHNLVFDCGTVPDGTPVTLDARELTSYRWAGTGDLDDVAPCTRQRITTALDALTSSGATCLTGPTSYERCLP